MRHSILTTLLALSAFASVASAKGMQDAPLFTSATGQVPYAGVLQPFNYTNGIATLGSMQCQFLGPLRGAGLGMCRSGEAEIAITVVLMNDILMREFKSTLPGIETSDQTVREWLTDALANTSDEVLAVDAMKIQKADCPVEANALVVAEAFDVNNMPESVQAHCVTLDLKK